MEDIKSLVKQRAVIKRKITMMFNEAEAKGDESFSNIAANKIKNLLEQITAVDTDLCNAYVEHEGDSEDISSEFDRELSNQSVYSLEISQRVSELELSVPSQNIGTNFDLKLPNLDCGTFSGEGNNSLEYTTFRSQFDNIIGLRSNLSNATKFTYLKSYLRGYALKVVKHLQITDSNYLVALDLLQKEFLNIESVIDDLFSKFLSLKPKPDPNFLKTKLYINECRCLLSDLKVHGVDLIGNDASNKLISHIILKDLPSIFKQEFCRKVGTNYPSIDLLFDHYVEIIRTVTMQNNNFSSVSIKSKPEFTVTANSTSNFNRNVNAPFKKSCKLCQNDSHSTISCRSYPDFNSRMKRCDDLEICNLYS